MRPKTFGQKVLLTTILLGAAFAFWERVRLQPVLAEHRRLSELLGDIEVDDPQHVYIKAIETGDPLEFAWWIHLPKGYVLSEEFIFSSSHQFSPPQAPLSSAVQFVLRLRIRSDSSRDEAKYSNGVDAQAGGSFVQLSGSASFVLDASAATKTIVGMALERPEELTVRQLGADAKQEFSPEEELVLLEIEASLSGRVSPFRVLSLRINSGRSFRGR